MQSVNPVLPAVGFTPEKLLAPRQAIVAFFARAALSPPRTEVCALTDARGRVLAQNVCADADYPSTARSVMDGFAISSGCAPGRFDIVGDVAMGAAPQRALAAREVMRIPTGGVLPAGADAVVPIEDARVEGDCVMIDGAVESGACVAPRGADMREGETILTAGRRIAAPEAGLLATLGYGEVRVYRRPTIAVISSGDELVDVRAHPAAGEIRDSNRYAIAASLQAMGATPHHYPTLRDESGDAEAALERALDECDGVVVSGGSSVGDRDRLPDAVARVARPGIVVHGLRVKPGKPTLFGEHEGKPIVGLPGNPASALFMLEAVAAPIVAAIVGAPVEPACVPARLSKAVGSRAGWTFFVPVKLHRDGGSVLAEPLMIRSFSVSLAARADGYVVMDESDERWEADSPVTVTRFL